MKRVAWLTDIHLDFLADDAAARFVDQVASENPDLVLITGDLSVARKLGAHLSLFAARLPVSTYFVLGNHDYYGSSIEKVRTAMVRVVEAVPVLRWLPHVGPVPLTERSALIGCDGWADSQIGNVETTPVRMTDFAQIQDLKLPRPERTRKLRELGAAEGARAAALLSQVESRFEHVWFATHVPPFVQACVYNGRPSPPDFLPFLVCQGVGDALLAFAERQPDVQVTVLCGHTHGGHVVKIYPNLEVRVGTATYGAPRIAAMIDVS